MLQELSHEDENDQNKLWLIVKYLTVDQKTNEFRITSGETIKLGRVKFIVREINTCDDEYQTDYDSFENNFLMDEALAPDDRLDNIDVD